jgi:hypothetical protein
MIYLYYTKGDEAYMKQLNEVVEMRNELKAKLEAVNNEKRSFRDYRPYSSLSKEEKTEYAYLISTTQKLRVQIDTLTYVINYDSELPDVTTKPDYSASGHAVWMINPMNGDRKSAIKGSMAYEVYVGQGYIEDLGSRGVAMRGDD